jgi:DNA-binding transcriptional ArsR family regulator
MKRFRTFEKERLAESIGSRTGTPAAPVDPRSPATAAQGDRVSRVFHALGDPTRRRILEMLSTGPQSVSRLAEPLGVTLTAVMQHLQILEECDLARTEKIGRVRTCRVETSGFAILEQWILARKTPLERGLDRLAKILSEEQDSDV